MGKKTKKEMPLSVKWTVDDDRELRSILQDEIKHLTKQIADAPNPTKKKKLRDRRKQYKSVLQKVDTGDYGSERFFLGEKNRGVYVNPFPKESSDAVSAYDDITFEYDEYFRKKRYYGFALPLLLIVLLAAFLFLPFLGNVLPAETQNDLGTESLHLGALFTYKLDEEHDWEVGNDGNWPTGTWAAGTFLEKGEVYKDAAGNIPKSVSLYKTLGMRSIDVTGLDLLTGIFFTTGKMPDFLKNTAFLNGNSWYYVRFMMNKDLSVSKGPDGKYDWVQVARVVSTYLIVYGFAIAMISAALSLVFALMSAFGYVSRRIHLLPLLNVVISLFLFLLPVFLPGQSLPEGDEFKTLFDPYFSFTNENFNSEASYQVMCGILPIVNLVLSALILFLPLMFVNSRPRYQTYVPKGNKPRRGSYDKAVNGG